MQVMDRIQQLMDERGWSRYRLQEESKVPQSTLAHMFQRDSMPTVPTLESICDAFGISLCQFFSEGEPYPLTEDQFVLLEKWARLTKGQQKVLLDLIDEIH